jgi:DNA-binding transcriptional LysR family regulator
VRARPGAGQAVYRYAEHTQALEDDLRASLGGEAIAELLDGQLDLGLVIGVVEHERLEAEPVMDGELVLIVPPDHRWASSQSVGTHDCSASQC